MQTEKNIKNIFPVLIFLFRDLVYNTYRSEHYNIYAAQHLDNSYRLLYVPRKNSMTLPEIVKKCNSCCQTCIE